MKRSVITILIFLLLGAAVNVVLAWACSYWHPWERSWGRRHGVFIDEHNDVWDGFDQSGVGWHVIWVYGSQRGTSPVDFRKLPSWVDPPTSNEHEQRTVFAWGSGWPAASLGCRLPGRAFAEPLPGQAWHTGWGPQRIEWGEWSFAIGVDDVTVLSLAPLDMRPLPVLPLWPGFVVNTLFYGVLVFALLRGPHVMRRIIRKRKGRCITCGYDLRGCSGGPCPECGAAVATSTDSGRASRN